MNHASVVTLGIAIVLAAVAGAAAVNQASGAQEAQETAPSPATESTGGTISGKISFAKKTRLRKKEFANVVVSLEDIETSDDKLEKALAARPKASINQKDLAFHPHVLPILVGETVGFPNSDPLFHNVYSQAKPKTFNLGMYPKGSSKEITFENPGLVELHCNVHAEMQAFILIAKNPYFATVQRDGTFRIENVPPGVHTIQAWHPKAEPITFEITVASGENVELNMEFTKRQGRKG